MSGLVSHARDGEVAILTLNNPPVNALSPALMAELRQALEAVAADPDVRAIVLIGGGRTFCGGADIKHFGKITSGQATNPDLDSSFKTILGLIEGSSRPIVAAIHGFAFGGGLELAMACHYRVAS